MEYMIYSGLNGKLIQQFVASRGHSVQFTAGDGKPDELRVAQGAVDPDVVVIPGHRVCIEGRRLEVLAPDAEFEGEVTDVPVEVGPEFMILTESNAPAIVQFVQSRGLCARIEDSRLSVASEVPADHDDFTEVRLGQRVTIKDGDVVVEDNQD